MANSSSSSTATFTKPPPQAPGQSAGLPVVRLPQPTPQATPSSGANGTNAAAAAAAAATTTTITTLNQMPEGGDRKPAPTPAPTSTSIRPTAGSKRTLMTHSKDGKLLSEKKLRRLEKNRLSARECRRRKREATEHLEREINVMEAENLRLRLQLQIGKEAEKSRMREQDKLTQDINDLLKSGASESDIHATLEEFKEKHADYGKSRRSAIEFHLRNIERLLMPTQTTSLVMHAIQGGNLDTSTGPTSSSAASVAAVPFPIASSSSSSSPAGSPEAVAAMSEPPQQVGLSTPAAAAATAPIGASTSSSPSGNFDPKALFHYLVNYLEVTPEQASVLKDSRRVSQELDGCLEEALAVLKELRQCLAQTGDDLEAEFNNVRSILTPTQAAKFLVWVANNGACMHMLNELWDRVYPAGNNSEGETTP